jgi:hypothetical protein
VTFAGNLPFLIKITAIIAGMVLAGIIQSRLRAELSTSAGAQVEPAGPIRFIAMASLACWITAIIAGRLIAYF